MLKLLTKQDHLGLKHLRVSATNWQHVSEKCFETFIYQKITKLQATQQLIKLKKNMFGILET
jgi:hypothetical protein